MMSAENPGPVKTASCFCSRNFSPISVCRSRLLVSMPFEQKTTGFDRRKWEYFLRNM